MMDPETMMPASVEELAPITAVPLRRPWRWISAAIMLIVLAQIVKGAVTAPNLHWPVVGHYLTNMEILNGLRLTLILTAVSMLVGAVLGTALAAMRMSSNPVLTTVSWIYGFIFRGTPLLAQLLFWYFLGAVVPTIGLGLPFGPTFVHWSTNSLLTQFIAAVLALTLNEAAFSAEIIRGGLLSVDAGQREAATALGMSNFRIFFKIVFPQAMRALLPPMGNEVINMLKATSLVLVIALPDLLTSAQLIYSRNFLQIPLIIVACIWYLAVISVLAFGQYYLERYYARGSNRQLPMTPLQRVRRVAVLALRIRRPETPRISSVQTNNGDVVS